MSNININKITEMTNIKIGYEHFEREDEMKKNKFNKAIYGLMGVCILTIGTVSVNALTDNSIGKAIDNLVKVKVNGKDYNSTCTERSDGSIYCKVGDTGAEYSITKEGRNYDFNFDISTEESDKDAIKDTETTVNKTKN
ncbi:MAG: hypothetical protein OSJ70_07110 [Bacilli bacterium]|nr:hypothetical protein [Bacilli bacterium]